MSKSLMGHSVSDTARQHMRKSAWNKSGNKNPMFGKHKEQHPHFGKFWVCNISTNIQKIICPIEWADYQKNNFQKGMLPISTRTSLSQEV
jgi:hypothetical protein